MHVDLLQPRFLCVVGGGRQQNQHGLPFLEQFGRLGCGVDSHRGHHGYKDQLRRALMIVLEKCEDGTWPWQSFESDYNATGMHRTYTYDSFHAYLKQWCKFSYDELRDLFARDAEVIDRLDAAAQRPLGANQHGGVDNVNSQKRPDGNSKEAALRRLRAEREDLHAQVLAGSISAHAAAVQAGFRRKSFTLTDADADTAAARIRQTFGNAFADALKGAL